MFRFLDSAFDFLKLDQGFFKLSVKNLWHHTSKQKKENILQGMDSHILQWILFYIFLKNRAVISLPIYKKLFLIRHSSISELQLTDINQYRPESVKPRYISLKNRSLIFYMKMGQVRHISKMFMMSSLTKHSLKRCCDTINSYFEVPMMQLHRWSLMTFKKLTLLTLRINI